MEYVQYCLPRIISTGCSRRWINNSWTIRPWRKLNQNCLHSVHILRKRKEEVIAPTAWTLPDSVCVPFTLVNFIHAAQMNSSPGTNMALSCRVTRKNWRFLQWEKDQVCKVDRLSTDEAGPHDVFLTSWADRLLDLFAFRVVPMFKQSDCSFALWAPVLHLGDPLLNAVVAVLVSAPVQSCQLLLRYAVQANGTDIALLIVRHFLKYFLVHVYWSAQACFSALSRLQVGTVILATVSSCDDICLCTYILFIRGWWVLGKLRTRILNGGLLGALCFGFLLLDAILFPRDLLLLFFFTFTDMHSSSCSLLRANIQLSTGSGLFCRCLFVFWLLLRIGRLWPLHLGSTSFLRLRPGLRLWCHAKFLKHRTDSIFLFSFLRCWHCDSLLIFLLFLISGLHFDFQTLND